MPPKRKTVVVDLVDDTSSSSSDDDDRAAPAAASSPAPKGKGKKAAPKKKASAKKSAAARRVAEDDDDDDEETSNASSSSADDDDSDAAAPAPSAKRSGGKKAAPKKKSAAKKAAGKRRGRDAPSEESEDNNDGSGSGSGSGSDESGSGSDDDSSSSDDSDSSGGARRRPAGKGKRAAAGKKASAKKAAKKKQQGSDDDNDDDGDAAVVVSSSGDDSGDDGDSSSSSDGGRPLRGRAGTLQLDASAQKVVDGFETLVDIPWPGVTAARATLKRVAGKKSAAWLRTRLIAAADWALGQWTGTDARPKPLVRPVTHVPATIPNLVPAAPEDCACLAAASETAVAGTKRKIIKQALADHGTLQMAVPTNTDPDAATGNRYRFVRNGAGWTWAPNTASPGRLATVPRLIATPAHLAHSVRVYGNAYGAYGTTVCLFSPAPIVGDGWRQLAKAAGIELHAWSRPYGPCSDLILVDNTASKGDPSKISAAHLQHQLYLRLRQVTPRDPEAPNGDFSDPCVLPFHTLPRTTEQLWAHRFAILSVLQSYAPQLIVSDPAAFCNGQLFSSDLMRAGGAVPTPAALFAAAKRVQQLSSKELLEALDTYLVRAGTDFSHVPERPPGMAEGYKLFPHQRRSIAFLLQSEKHGRPHMTVVPPLDKPPLTAGSGSKGTKFRYHVNMALGALVAAAVGSPEERQLLDGGKRRGSILGDSVGLGKTLSSLSLCVLNPCPYPTPVVRDSPDSEVGMSVPPDPVANKSNAAARPMSADEARLRANAHKKLYVKATLLLAPVSLVVAWEHEIKTFYPHLKVLRLHGQQRAKATYAAVAAADIVITTYETYRIMAREEQYFMKWLSVHEEFVALSQQKHAQGASADVNRLLAELSAHGPGASVQQWQRETKAMRTLGQNGPSSDRPFLSRVVFWRLVMDEVQKSSALTDDFPYIAEAQNLLLVSGTVLDCNFASAAKRLGVCDFSFTPTDRVRFCVNAKEGPPPRVCDAQLQRTLQSDKALGELSCVLETPEDSYVAPPTAVASFAKVALLSSVMTRQTLETCPELARIKLEVVVVPLQHSAEEREAFEKSRDAVRKKFLELEKRGRVTTRILSVIQLLNQLRAAAFDPLAVSIHAEDALVAGHNGGAQFEAENSKRAMIPIPAALFGHLMFRNNSKFAALFPDPSPAVQRALSAKSNSTTSNNGGRKKSNEDGAAAAAAAANEIDADAFDPDNKSYAFVHRMASKASIPESLATELSGMLQKPPVLPCCCCCLDSVMAPCVFQCCHMICRECVLNLRQNNALADGEQSKTQCPVCRDKVLDDTKAKALLTFPSLAALVSQDAKEEDAAEHCSQRQRGDNGSSDDDDALERAQLAAELKAAGSTPTKVRAIIQIIEDTLQQDATAKFVLFTSFPSVLSSVRRALTAASIGSVVIDGATSLTARGKAISMFQDRTSYNIRCCILSSRVAAAGLTLTAAANLIICEPLTNADQRTQVIGRIHRLSQEKSCRIFDLVVESTPERAIYDMVLEKTLTLSSGGSEPAKQAVIETIRRLLWPDGAPVPGEGDDDDDDDDANNNNGGGGGGGGGAVVAAAAPAPRQKVARRQRQVVRRAARPRQYWARNRRDYFDYESSGGDESGGDEW